ncbi:MAG: class I SAM-dependent methyltransferase [Candidatus Micrarchaeota archaeon]
MRRKPISQDHVAEGPSFRRLERILGSEPARALREKDAVFLGQLMPIIGKNLKGKKILEIGPGHGFFVELLRDLGADAYGIDSDINSFYHYNNALFQESIIRYGDASNISEKFPNEQFDYIVSNAVLCREGLVSSLHTVNPDTGKYFSAEEMANNIHRSVFESLKPGGITFHSTAEPILGNEQTLQDIGYVILCRTKNNLILQKPAN